MRGTPDSSSVRLFLNRLFITITTQRQPFNESVERGRKRTRCTVVGCLREHDNYVEGDDDEDDVDGDQ